MMGKLTAPEKQAIRHAYQQGVRPSVLAEAYDVAEQTVKVLVRNLDHAPWQTKARSWQRRQPKPQPLPETGIRYLLPRRCGHVEWFALHTAPSWYYRQCVREEWCAACVPAGRRRGAGRRRAACDGSDEDSAEEEHSQSPRPKGRGLKEPQID